MNKNILNTGVQEYICNFSNNDILAVLLQKQIFTAIDNKELVQQIQSRRKCIKKLPTWYDTPRIYYPPKLSIEQSSSEITARYKSQLISGRNLIDLTGGFGVDSYFLSQAVDQHTYCEKDPELALIASHNFEVLGATNIEEYQGDGLQFLAQSDRTFDWVFLDPSRRIDAKKRIFLLGDAEPPLPDTLPIIWRKTNHILIKTAPLLDLLAGMTALGSVKQIHVVALRNEVKEVLWVLEKDFRGKALIKTINIRKGPDQEFNFKLSEEKEAQCAIGAPDKYIYEPNAAILKSGAFKLIAERLKLSKLHEHSHLYTSRDLKEFPGRRFKLDKNIPYNTKTITQLQIAKANISTRNFSISVPELRRKLQIKDGGDLTLFFTKDHRGNLVVLLCSPIPDGDE